jgi:predicted XRE-type DNA-binding protein
MKIKSKHISEIYWEEGSKNVFADLEMHDSSEKLAKANLALKINDIISQRKLTQVAAAKLLGVDQSKISLINKGRLKDFSIERLSRFLILLNYDVEIVVKKSKKTSLPGQLKVIYGV